MGCSQSSVAVRSNTEIKPKWSQVGLPTSYVETEIESTLEVLPEDVAIDIADKEDYTSLENRFKELESAGKFKSFIELFDNVCECLTNEQAIQWDEQMNNKSSYARLVIAKAYATYAWEARGTGYANTLSPEDVRKFNKRMRAMEDIVTSLEKELDDYNPAFYEIALASCLNRSTPRKETKRLAYEYADRAVELYRTKSTDKISGSRDIIGQLTQFLMPKWYGKPMEALSAVEKYSKVSEPLNPIHGLFVQVARDFVDEGLSHLTFSLAVEMMFNDAWDRFTGGMKRPKHMSEVHQGTIDLFIKGFLMFEHEDKAKEVLITFANKKTRTKYYKLSKLLDKDGHPLTLTEKKVTCNICMRKAKTHYSCRLCEHLYCEECIERVKRVV